MLRCKRDRGLLVLLVLIGVLAVLDFAATEPLVVYEGHSEWNPLMRRLVGTPYFAVYKLLAIPLGLVFIWLVRQRIVPKFMGAIVFTCGVYALVLVYTWVVFYYP